MLRVILFVLVTLICNFAESKVQLSKKYTPLGNPGGKEFKDDEEFAKLYKLYEKRREALKKRNSQKVQPQVKKKGHQSGCLVEDTGRDRQSGCVVEDTNENAMVNKYGINLARLKGAIFIDQEDQTMGNKPVEDEQDVNKSIESEQMENGDILEKDQQEHEIQKEDVHEKKVSTMNITVRDAYSRRRICSHDSIMNE